MSVISLSITESEQEIVSGIPTSITIEANIVCVIFYTLDGTTPTTDSLVYVGPISLPTNYPSVTLKIYATNGTDSSSIISNTYAPSNIGLRRPFSTVTNVSNTVDNRIDKAPFGDNFTTPPYSYGKSGGITVDDSEIENVVRTGYDSLGEPSESGMDREIKHYEMIYSTTNRQGESGHGIGQLPIITIQNSAPPPIQSSTKDRVFNAKALVIYQDSRDGSRTMLNRPYFNWQDLERSRNGALLFNSAYEANNITGSFVRQYFNPQDNTITYYYRDSDSGRWIISKEPFSPKNSNIGSYSNMVFLSRSPGDRYVYPWVPFQSRKLF